MESTEFNSIAHQDLINSNIGMLPQWGAGQHYTNYLHGMQMHAQPDTDKFVLMKQKDKEGRNAFLISLAALGTIMTSAVLLFKGKMNFKGLGNSIATPFKWIGSTVAKLTKSVGRGIGKGCKAVGHGVSTGVKAVGHAIAAPFKWIGNKFHKKT